MLFLVHFSASIFAVICVVMIDVNLFGMMSYWNVPLNAVSMINLVMSVGFSVDYAAHIGRFLFV